MGPEYQTVESCRIFESKVIFEVISGAMSARWERLHQISAPKVREVEERIWKSERIERRGSVGPPDTTYSIFGNDFQKRGSQELYYEGPASSSLVQLIDMICGPEIGKSGY